MFPADAGQRATVKAKITLPENATWHGTSTWQVDVYDGPRRRQACMYGRQTGKAGADASAVELTCVLRTVRAWAEPWANDPLPGSYYVRLTVVDLPSADLGLPVRTEVEVTAADKGGAGDVDGTLAQPLVPGVSSVAQASDGSSDDGDGATPKVSLGSEPEDGWASGWWTDRWLWTVGGGILGALAGVFGYSSPAAAAARPGSRRASDATASSGGPGSRARPTVADGVASAPPEPPPGRHRATTLDNSRTA